MVTYIHRLYHTMMFAIVRLYQLLTQSCTMKYLSNCNYNISICSMLHARPESTVDIYYCVCIGIRNWGVGVSFNNPGTGGLNPLHIHAYISSSCLFNSQHRFIRWLALFKFTVTIVGCTPSACLQQLILELPCSNNHNYNCQLVYIYVTAATCMGVVGLTALRFTVIRFFVVQ